MSCWRVVVSKKKESGNREVKKPKQKKTLATPLTVDALAVRGVSPPGRKA
jgi:hypothetical protein